MAKGGPRPGSGRPKGAKTKVGQDVRELARQYTTEAVETLVNIMAGSDNDQARGMAADKLLDRGWGKPSQTVAHSGDADNPIRHSIDINILGGRQQD